MTGRRHASSEVALDSGLPQLRAALDVDPSLLLAGDVPRLLDEWQIESSLWNLVRREIDSRRHPGGRRPVGVSPHNCPRPAPSSAL